MMINIRVFSSVIDNLHLIDIFILNQFEIYPLNLIIQDPLPAFKKKKKFSH